MALEKDAQVPSSVIGRFTSTYDYERSLRELDATITPTRPGAFTASLIHVDLPMMRLMRMQESAPRIAFLSIPQRWRYAIFLTQPGSPLIWNGEALSVGDIMLSGDGERLHQRTSEGVSLGVVGIPDPMLEHYASGLIGRPLALLSDASIVNLQTSQKQQLLRLHARIGRLVETRPNTICHPEASRAIEQELIETLVTCLVNGDARRPSPHGHTIGRTLASLESLLAQGGDRAPTTAEMCTDLGISEQSLRSYCAASFDMSPNRYARQRRAERRKESGQQ
jgi:AraC-like DNA-binding protein